jgi:hypothetical protein
MRAVAGEWATYGNALRYVVSVNDAKEWMKVASPGGQNSAWITQKGWAFGRYCLHCISRNVRTNALDGRQWCADCAPSTKPPGVRHGYYLAGGKRHGDPELSEEAEKLYLGLGIDAKAAGPFNSVSVYETKPGAIKRVATLHNLFDPEQAPVTYDFGV